MSQVGFDFSIRVVDEDGDGISGIGVAVSYYLGGTSIEYTDEDGWARFHVVGFGAEIMREAPVSEIFIDHTQVEGRTTVSEDETYSYTFLSLGRI